MKLETRYSQSSRENATPIQRHVPISLLLGPLGGNWNDKQKALRIKRMTQNAKHRPPSTVHPPPRGKIMYVVREGRGSILGMLAFLST